MTIPDAAIEAAAEAMRGAYYTKGTNDNDLARAAIEAAMPAIREAIAQEIEADQSDDWTDAPRHHAARIVRGGAA